MDIDLDDIVTVECRHMGINRALGFGERVRFSRLSVTQRRHPVFRGYGLDDVPSETTTTYEAEIASGEDGYAIETYLIECGWDVTREVVRPRCERCNQELPE